MDFPGETTDEDGRPAQVLEIIAERMDSLTPKPSRTHRLSLRCGERPGDAVRLRVSVDGGAPITATDARGMGPFTAAFAFVMTDRPRTDVRFDHLTADGPAAEG